MSADSDYDQRQYRRMAEILANYEKHECSLATVVSTIEGLIGVLESVSTARRNELLSCWGVFEEVYAVGLEQGQTDLDAIYAEPIARGIRDLKRLIVEHSGVSAA